MFTSRSILVLLSPLLLGGSFKEEIVFRVAAETTLARTLASTYSMELESLALTMDGEEVPAEYFGEMSIQIEHEEHYRVTDVFASLVGGRPARLVRTFDELGGKEHTRYSSEEGEENQDNVYASALEDKSVVFTWNEESERFDVAFGGGSEGDEALLEKLEEDMDLRQLLPRGTVEQGESWQVEAHVFQCILDPGGDLALVVSDGEDEDTSAQDEQLNANLSGTITATYRGAQVEAGVRQARITLAIDARTFAEEELSAEDSQGGSGTGRTEVGFLLEGELCWDLEHGHALSLELSGENSLTMVQNLTGESEGESFEQSQTMEFAGQMSFTLRVERP